mmetsp:Transcript_3940/g.6684  ORF Transcript_3940/g.6684 Transcript_3940/m.6684 type:complete len:82 (-) Transcript_3940:1044-1289(-)
MRTPLNAIATQAVRIRFLKGKLQDLIAESALLTPEQLAAKLEAAVAELEDCRVTLGSSCDFLLFVVNDMLDLSQIKQGKLR